MSTGCRRNAVVIGCLSLFSSLLFAGWSPLSSGVTTDLLAVDFPESTEVGYAVGNDGVILKTTDGGGTWAPQTSGVTTQLFSVSFADNSTGFAVGDEGTALKTTDGGATWLPMNAGTGALLAVQFAGTNGTAYVVYDDRTSASIRKTTDWGGSWQDQTLPGMNHPVRCLFFTSESVGFSGGSLGYLVRTYDGGASYQPLGTGVGSIGYQALAFRPGDPSVGYVGGSDTSVSTNVIFQTTNSGDTWLTLDPPEAQQWNALACPDGPAGVFAAGTGGMIAKYTQGTGWKVQATGVAAAINGLSFPADGLVGYAVGTGGVILKTTDGGIGVEEAKNLSPVRAGIRVLSNPCRQGISLFSDRDAAVAVFDVSGRVLMTRAATKGLNFLPLNKAGAYIVKAGAEAASVVVTN